MNKTQILEGDLAVLHQVNEYWKKHGIPPTYRDMQVACHRSTSIISHVYIKLVGAGYLVLVDGKPIPTALHEYIKRYFENE